MDIAHSPQLHVEYLPLAALKLDSNNPRQHSPKQIKALARAIKDLGFNNPILIDHQSNIIAGHGRLEAAIVNVNGFEYQGKIYNSLSKIAGEITGKNWNGWIFFGLKRAGQI